MITFIANPQALERLFNSPSGPLARNIAQKAIRVESQAKVNASGRPGPRVRTGRLRSSIHWEIVVQNGNMFARVGSRVQYARAVEMGTKNARPYPYLRPALAAAR